MKLKITMDDAVTDSILLYSADIVFEGNRLAVIFSHCNATLGSKL